MFLFYKAEETGGFGNGKTHYVEIITGDSFYEHGAFALDPICAGFVHWLESFDVAFDCFIGKFVKFDFGFLDEGTDGAFFGNGDAGIDEVLFAGKSFEHGMSMGFILRLAENFAAEHDDGIGTDNDIVRTDFGNGKSLLFRKDSGDFFGGGVFGYGFFAAGYEDFKFGDYET